MDDFYTEQLIKKQADSKDTLKKAGLIVLTVLSVLLVFAIPVGIIFPVVMIVVDVLVFSNTPGSPVRPGRWTAPPCFRQSAPPPPPRFCWPGG